MKLIYAIQPKNIANDKSIFEHLQGFLMIPLISPPIFQNPKVPNFVFELRKTCYNLKQCDKVWYDKWRSFLI